MWPHASDAGQSPRMRPRRAVTLIEAAVVLLIMLAVVALSAPRFVATKSAGSVKMAQQAVEKTLDAAYRGRGLTGSWPPPSRLSVPGVAVLDEATAAGSPAEVSVGVSGEKITAVSSDGARCWAKTVDLGTASGAVDLVVTFLPGAAGCTASNADSLAVGSPPPGFGGEWSRPWTVG